MNLESLDIKKVRKKAKTISAAFLVGVSGAAGSIMLDDSQTDNSDVPQNIDNVEESPTEISSQIAENRNKLETLSASSEDQEVDYTKMGC